MFQKNAHEILSPEVLMVKSYDVLKSGYLYEEKCQKPVFNDKYGVFPDVM